MGMQHATKSPTVQRRAFYDGLDAPPIAPNEQPMNAGDLKPTQSDDMTHNTSEPKFCWLVE
jgi:hypothetical protein